MNLNRDSLKELFSEIETKLDIVNDNPDSGSKGRISNQAKWYIFNEVSKFMAHARTEERSEAYKEAWHRYSLNFKKLHTHKTEKVDNN